MNRADTKQMVLTNKKTSMVSCEVSQMDKHRTLGNAMQDFFVNGSIESLEMSYFLGGGTESIH